jgi:hypothetical protein
VTRPARGIVLVKPLETEESLPGGLIVLTDNTRQAFTNGQVEIVAIGEPEICEDPENCNRRHDGLLNSDFHLAFSTAQLEPGNKLVHPIDKRLKPGSWALIRPRALVDAGSETEKLYLVRQSDIVGIFTEHA